MIDTITHYSTPLTASTPVSFLPAIDTNPLYPINREFYWKIKGFSNLEDDWDKLGTCAPSPTAIGNALFTLRELYQNDVVPNHVNATSDESIIFEIYNENGRFLFEFFNDGDIVFMKKQPTQREVIDISKEMIPMLIRKMA
jgi:hypothetical protein